MKGMKGDEVLPSIGRERSFGGVEKASCITGLD